MLYICSDWVPAELKRPSILGAQKHTLIHVFSKMNLRVNLCCLVFCTASLNSDFSIIPRTFPAPFVDCFAFLCYTIFVWILDMYLLPETFHYIMEIMWCLFLSKQQGPIVQSFAGVLYRWSWYRFLLCRCCCVPKYQPTWRCLSQYHKRFGQIACADCGETPCWLLLRLPCRGISSAPKYCSGPTAFRFW